MLEMLSKCKEAQTVFPPPFRPAQMQAMHVNMDAVTDAQLRSEELGARAASKQQEAARSGLNAAVAQERTSLDEIQAKVSQLRQASAPPGAWPRSVLVPE